MEKVSEKVCVIQGHRIITLADATTHPETIVCLQCGLTLEEIQKNERKNDGN
jgi:hypothetical protein